MKTTTERRVRKTITMTETLEKRLDELMQIEGRDRSNLIEWLLRYALRTYEPDRRVGAGG